MSRDRSILLDPERSDQPPSPGGDLDSRRQRRRHRSLRRFVLPAVGLAAAGFSLLAVTQAAAARRDMSLAKSSLETARAAVSSRQIDAANEALDIADAHLTSASHKTKRLPLNLVGHVPLIGSPVKAIAAGTSAAREAVAAGRILSAAAGALPTSGAAKFDGHDLSAFHTASISSLAALDKANGHFNKALATLEGPVGAFLPQISKPAKELVAQLLEASDQLFDAERSLNLLSKLTDPATNIRLLFISQDTMEMRPTGGFIGSFGVLHVAHGTIELERYEGIEALPDAEPPMAAPAELGAVLVKPWGLSNINWWPDFPTSASAAVEMFKRQGGGEVDGVLSFNEDTMARLVGALGSVQVPGYQKPVTGDGFAQRALYEVELKRPPDNPKKKFLILMADVVFHRLFQLPADKVPALVDALGRSAGEGSLQVWFANPAWQTDIADSSIDGALPHPDFAQDFLHLTEANMTASKANADLTRKASYQVERAPEGRLRATLQIDYLNSGPGSLMNPYYNGQVWIYVPQGSELVSGTGELAGDPASPYAVITAKVFVQPNGGQQVLSFEYLLPETVAEDGHYHLLWLRQVGMSRDSLVANIGDRVFEPADNGRHFLVDTDL